MVKKLSAIQVPMTSEDHEIDVGLKETIIIGLATAALTVLTATSIHAFRERSRRKTYKSMADSVGSVISKFMEVELSSGGGSPRQLPSRIPQKALNSKNKRRGNK